MNSKFHKKLLQLKHENDLCLEVDCSEEENQKYKDYEELPANIGRREDVNGVPSYTKFYKIVPLDISHEEVQEYCALKQTKYLKTIRNCVVFFTALTVVSLLILFFILLLQV